MIGGKVVNIFEESDLKSRIIDQVVAVAMASHGPQRVGAILLKKNKIVAAACNNYTKSDPYQAKISKQASLFYNCPNYSKRIYGHAETIALKKIQNGDADTIVVCRLSGRHNSKKLRMARPCELCYFLITNFFQSIHHVHYSTENGFMYERW